MLVFVTCLHTLRVNSLEIFIAHMQIDTLFLRALLPGHRPFPKQLRKVLTVNEYYAPMVLAEWFVHI